MEHNSVVFAISMLNGGGAEKVLLLLAEGLARKGKDVLLLITNQKKADAYVPSDAAFLNFRFALDELSDSNPNCLSTLPERAICKMFERIGHPAPDFAAKKSFLDQYQQHVNWARDILKQKKGCPVVAFLQPTNQIILMAVDGLENPVILSERSDPERYFKSRYAPFFLKHYYGKIAAIVFQTPYAMSCYPASIQKLGAVIPNPLQDELPMPTGNERVSRIVNFCRITTEKNLKLLIDAFEVFHALHPDYKLEIIGDGPEKQKIEQLTQDRRIRESVILCSHMADVTAHVIDYKMFVSSSDWEGLSNSMLEAMAIGLPTICTDCGGGGARYIIRDHENGLLVPVRDCESLCRAMCEIAEDSALCDKLSQEAVKIRQQLSQKEILKQWEAIIFDSSFYTRRT